MGSICDKHNTGFVLSSKQPQQTSYDPVTQQQNTSARVRWTSTDSVLVTHTGFIFLEINRICEIYNYSKNKQVWFLWSGFQSPVVQSHIIQLITVLTAVLIKNSDEENKKNKEGVRDSLLFTNRLLLLT